MAGLDRNKKRGDSSNPRVSRFSEVLGAALDSTHKSGYPESQPSEQSATQLSAQPKEKLAKRENPDYTQTTFRIPKKLSRQINIPLTFSTCGINHIKNFVVLIHRDILRIPVLGHLEGFNAIAIKVILTPLKVPPHLN